jgi:hypothetical protein
MGRNLRAPASRALFTAGEREIHKKRSWQRTYARHRERGANSSQHTAMTGQLIFISPCADADIWCALSHIMATRSALHFIVGFCIHSMRLLGVSLIRPLAILRLARIMHCFWPIRRRRIIDGCVCRAPAMCENNTHFHCICVSFIGNNCSFRWNIQR